MQGSESLAAELAQLKLDAPGTKFELKRPDYGEVLPVEEFDSTKRDNDASESWNRNLRDSPCHLNALERGGPVRQAEGPMVEERESRLHDASEMQTGGHHAVSQIDS